MLYCLVSKSDCVECMNPAEKIYNFIIISLCCVNEKARNMNSKKLGHEMKGINQDLIDDIVT